jgi:hypothetical protein
MIKSVSDLCSIHDRKGKRLQLLAAAPYFPLLVVTTGNNWMMHLTLSVVQIDIHYFESTFITFAILIGFLKIPLSFYMIQN